MRKMLLNVAVTATAIVGLVVSSATPVRPADEVKLGAGLAPKAGAAQTAPNQFKKNPPWKIAFSLPGMGNT
ncbi:MAG TPA: hypothetical protein VLW86_10550, partial [Syntrophorhabdales bacterium]|nr:hypothetical protein [Syntrophorhabdales bacterium]